uniref:Pre-C2HC domain-containing protein n=1 Tax=Graphocephala atropunctata TaxID=36148 RepID=A0A1B6LDV0_9HEMI
MGDELAENESQKPVKPPHIFIHDVNNHQEIVKDVQNLISSDFSTELKGTALKINLIVIDDFRKLTKFYDESNVEYRTLQTKVDRKLEVVTKNVPCSLTPEEVKAELISQNYSVLTVGRLFNKDKTPYPICAVSLENNESGKYIFHFNRLNYSEVRDEPK